MSKAAVILSGCGYLDGAEIRESVLCLLYLDKAGVEVSIFAPNIDQSDVIDHSKQSPQPEKRNTMIESARIARGRVAPLAALDAAGFDMLIMPGGYGVAKNLSDFAEKGADCQVLPDLNRIIHAFFEAQKPICAVCIAPAVLAASLKNKGLRLTIGEDESTAAAIEQLGHQHETCPSDAAVIDAANKIATASAYMREDSLAQIAIGIEHAIQAVLKMLQEQPLTKVS